MKIVLLTGASKSVLWFRKELIAYLLQKGHEVTVLSCDGRCAKDIENLGVNFMFTGGNNVDTGVLSNVKYFFTVKKLIAKIKPDMVFCFQAKANTIGCFAARAAKVKRLYLMIEGRGNAFLYGSVKRFLTRMTVRALYRFSTFFATKVFVLNESDKHYFLSRNIIARHNICLLDSIGIDVNEYVQTVPVEDGETHVLMLSRAIIEKGVKDYCEAAKIIKEMGRNDIKFEYYGDEGTASGVLARYSHEGYVLYGGYLPDVKPVLDRCHVFVLPSYYNEGIPRTVLEAMAKGRPIVVSETVGKSMGLFEGEIGAFVKPRDAAHLAEIILFCADNRDVLATWGKQSRKLCEERFDSKLINDSLWKVIEDE